MDLPTILRLWYNTMAASQEDITFKMAILESIAAKGRIRPFDHVVLTKSSKGRKRH